MSAETTDSQRPVLAPAAPAGSHTSDGTHSGRCTSVAAEQDSVLTPIRAHYLKKTLVQLQFNREIQAITASSATNVSTFSYLGPPFAPPPRDARRLDLPFLRYIFKQYVLTFPFMAAAPKNFYSEKLQPFLDSTLSRNLSAASILDDDIEDSEQETRLKLITKMVKNFSLFLSSATKLVEREELVRLSQRDLHRLEALAKKRQSRHVKWKNVFDVNIICVRTVTDRKRMRNKVHEEFIIRTRRSDYPDSFVSRRYGDFRTLADELRKAHPEELVRAPPAKDKSTSSVAMSPTPTAYTSVPMSRATTSESASRSSLDSTVRSPTIVPPPQRLIRENNRLTLRAYLHSLMASSTIASSPVLRSFLTSGPTTLSSEEVEDARQREEADRVREEGRKRFAQEIASRVEGLRDAVRSVKGDMMGKDGLTQIFSTVKVTQNVCDLPSNYQAVLEWARISLAATVFQHLVAADDASETLASVKRIHGLMPYMLLKAALKISNPIAMVRSVLDLFLAQPFGGPSLLQRMFTSSLTEEVKYLEEDIEAVKSKVDDAVMCEKIKLFVYASRDIQEQYKRDAESEKLNILAIVLRSRDAPILNHQQMQRVVRSHKAHELYIKSREALGDSVDGEGPRDQDAWLFEDLKVLAHLYSRLRDREQLIALVFEGSTAELLKDIITIFYSPLAQVYKAASISESLGDLQNFIGDLIKTVDQLDDVTRDDPTRTVQTFIDLIQRHEQAFYTFVHNVHSKGEGVFDSLMHWVERFLTVIREGIGEPVSLEYLLPHTRQERASILQEVDAVALYHYKLKVAHEEKIRRRFLRLQGQSSADAEDEATQALVQDVVEDIDFGDLVQGGALDLANDDSDDSDSDVSSETDSSSEEGSDESEESDSDESVPHKPFIRSPAVDQPPKLPPAKSPISPDQSRPGPVTLKSSRSSTSLRQRARQNNTKTPPPVPTLPNSVSKVASNTHPSTPPSRMSADAARSPPSAPHGTPKAAHKKRAPALKHPDLQHIPMLLPIFTELMRPTLYSRQQPR